MTTVKGLYHGGKGPKKKISIKGHIQTQVATVIEYYNRWMQKWPTLQHLAEATLEEVNEMWSGLGYYSRGRRLHEGALKVVQECGGEMPRTAETLLKELPGVGRYTAGAIASIAYNEPTGLVDGNVVRVFSRLRCIGADCTSQHVTETLWGLANTTVCPERPGDYNQSLMELGATVCTPKSPMCAQCPVQHLCRAYSQVQRHKRDNAAKLTTKPDTTEKDGTLCDIECAADSCKLCSPAENVWDASQGVMNYPRKPKKKAARVEKTAVCVIGRPAEGVEEYLLIQRPPSGLLANLWEFPSVGVGAEDTETLCRGAMTDYLLDNIGVTGDQLMDRKHVGEVVHLFSHIHQTYVVESARLDASACVSDIVLNRPTRWLSKQDMAAAALSTAMKKVFKSFEGTQQSSKSARGEKRKRAPSGQTDGKKQLGLAAFFKPKTK